MPSVPSPWKGRFVCTTESLAPPNCPQKKGSRILRRSWYLGRVDHRPSGWNPRGQYFRGTRLALPRSSKCGFANNSALARVSYFPIIVGQLFINVSGESGFSVFTRKRPSGATSYWKRTKVAPTMWVWNSTRGVPAVFFTGSNVVLINFLSGPR